ncbi:MAG: M20 family metallopeptidase [Candidatus Heimdallarchaeota archaeon]
MAKTVDHRFIEETLISLIRVNSENPPGNNKEIVDYLAELAKREGLRFERQSVTKEMENIVIFPSWQISPERIITLIGHTDTVPIGNLENWTKDPFGEDRDGDIIFGRGAADMKGGLAAALAVVKCINQLDEPPQITPVFIGTADEEVLMRGADKILAHKRLQNTPEFAVIGEPTGLDMGIAGKGCLHIKLHIKGVAAHGSRPELGINAIDTCYDIIRKIRKNMPSLTDDLLGSPTVNLAALHGGTAFIVPDSCEAELDFRFPSPLNCTAFENIVREACETVEKPSRASCEIVRCYPPVHTSDHHPLIKAVGKELEVIGKKSKFCGLSYCTDGSILIPKWKTPFLLFGPGNPNALHVADEWVSISETIMAAQVLSKAILATYSKRVD